VKRLRGGAWVWIYHFLHHHSVSNARKARAVA
jgi:hypothetical protein